MIWNINIYKQCQAYCNFAYINCLLINILYLTIRYDYHTYTLCITQFERPPYSITSYSVNSGLTEWIKTVYLQSDRDKTVHMARPSSNWPYHQLICGGVPLVVDWNDTLALTCYAVMVMIEDWFTYRLTIHHCCGDALVTVRTCNLK